MILFGLSLITIVGLIWLGGLAVFIIRRFREQELTTSHVPAIILLGLGLTAGFGTVVGYELADRELNGVEYTAQAEQPPSERSSADQETPSDTPERLTTSIPGTEMGGPYEFDELSPDAQSVFLSTLESAGAYTTRTSPAEFQDESPTDVGGPGYAFVRYDSAWYKLTADAGGGPLAGLRYIPLLFGVFVTFIALLAGWITYLTFGTQGVP